MNYLSLNFWHEQCSEYFIGFHVNLCNQLETEIGEGNGKPLQYSWLENPVDRGAWWAAVHRVAQSWTWLKPLSMHACIGEGNGNPLQYSCLENPRDRAAWWAAVYGVAQSQTQLKRLSSSSSSDRNIVDNLFIMIKLELRKVKEFASFAQSICPAFHFILFMIFNTCYLPMSLLIM